MQGVGRNPDNRILFMGNSCFPISPCLDFQQDEKSKGGTKISENDQFIKIIQDIGPQNDDDMSFLTD